MLPRVALVTPWVIEDSTSWSGMILPMAQALEASFDVERISTRDVKNALADRVVTRLLDGRAGRVLPGHLVRTARRRGKQLGKRLRAARAEVVVAVASSTDIAYLQSDLPIVYVTDATFHAVADFYPLFADLYPWARRQGEEIERRAIARADRVVVSSEWAQQSVTGHYQKPLAEVSVVPFGPRIDSGEGFGAVPPHDGLSVLVVASDWHRKGGEHALAAVHALHGMGVAAQLTVVGDHPDLPSWATGLGRVAPEEMRRLYADHDVLLELALANAGGVTLTDAAHAGLPVVATEVGGVSTVIDHGVTGILVSPSPHEVAGQAAAALQELASRQRRTEMSAAARQRASSMLSWEAWGAAMSELIGSLYTDGARRA